jgi:hypothetical protein
MNQKENVQCNVCNHIFTDCFSTETNQAYDCAADFLSDDDGSYILCHYGSSFDTSKFIIQKTSSLFGKEGVICDQCIQNLIDQKEIALDKNYNYWSTLEDVQLTQKKPS